MLDGKPLVLIRYPNGLSNFVSTNMNLELSNPKVLRPVGCGSDLVWWRFLDWTAIDEENVFGTGFSMHLVERLEERFEGRIQCIKL